VVPSIFTATGRVGLIPRGTRMVLVSATKLAAQASECDRLSTWVVTLSSLDPVTCTDVGRVAHTQRQFRMFTLRPPA
jgi:hypothetical protein